MDRPTFFPAGTHVSEPRSEFRIRIWYREPGYARKSGGPPQNYRWTFAVLAQDDAEAKVLAQAEFRRMEKLSSVGWTREITEIVVVD